MLFVGEQILKLAPKPSAEVLASVPRPKKAVVCLKEKTRVLDKLHSGVSHCAVGRKFNVNESTTRYIQEKQEEICKSVLEAAPGKAKIKSRVHNETLEKWLNLWTPFGIDAREVTTNYESAVDNVV